MRTITLRCDGGCESNPGQMSIGGLLEEGDKVLTTYSEKMGYGTNNIAEYLSLIKGLEEAKRFPLDKLIIYMDSKLVVEQVNGNWRVYNELLKGHLNRAKELLKTFPNVSLSHVLRGYNREADSLTGNKIYKKAFGKARYLKKKKLSKGELHDIANGVKAMASFMSIPLKTGVRVNSGITSVGDILKSS